VGSRSIFNADHDLFRENVRKFMKEELAPQQAAFEEQGGPTTDIWEKLGAQGLLGVAIPEEAGGIGGTFLEEAIVQEEQAYAQALSPNIIVHSAIVMPYFLNYGTPEQIKKYMPDMTAGKRIGAIGMTEPDAGSDLQGIRTNAKRDGDDYIINGSKTYISNGIVGNTIVVVAVTDPTAKSKAHGISLFIVDKGTKGFKNGKNLKKMGLKGQDTAELFFEDVRVPKENLLGGLNEGFYLLMKELPQERLSKSICDSFLTVLHS
jgi:long-chain-acyl-CoA dehydrogenase